MAFPDRSSGRADSWLQLGGRILVVDVGDGDMVKWYLVRLALPCQIFPLRPNDRYHRFQWPLPASPDVGNGSVIRHYLSDHTASFTHDASGVQHHRRAAFGGAYACLGNHQCAAAIFEPDRRRRARLDRFDKRIDLAPVRLAVAVDEKMQQGIAAHPFAAVALERRRLVVARDQHAFFAESLDALVVAVNGPE